MDLKIEGHGVRLASVLRGQDPRVLEHLLRARRKQSAIELLAILKVLREQYSLPTLAPETILRSLNPATFARLWSSPAAYLWTRLAYGFVKAAPRDSITINFAEWLGVSDSDLLGPLIERLWLLALAGLVIDERSYEFKPPISLPVIGTLPTLGISWRASNPFHIHGTEGGRVRVKDNGGKAHTLATSESVPGLEIIEQELLIDDAKLYLDVWSEHALANFKGIEQVYRIDSKHELQKQAKALRHALEEIKKIMPGIYSEMALLLQTITPLQPVNKTLPSSSNSAITGAIWYTATDEPLLIAEMLIHEHSHNKLFLIQDIDPLIDPYRHGSGWEPRTYYSPWRDDPRPLNGILHGYFVFSEVAQFWAYRLCLEHSDDLSLRRFGMLVRQLQYARSVLEQHCSFTGAGYKIMELLGSRMDEQFIPTATQLGTDRLAVLHMESNDTFDADSSLTIAAAVQSHRQQWEMKFASKAM